MKNLAARGEFFFFFLSRENYNIGLKLWVEIKTFEWLKLIIAIRLVRINYSDKEEN